MTTWIGIGLSIACLFAAEAALAAPLSGPGDAVESAVVRFMTIVQSEHANGAPLPADRVSEIREIVREMFDFDEISRRALSKHWQALQRSEARRSPFSASRSIRAAPPSRDRRW
jgi:MlaC protein